MSGGWPDDDALWRMMAETLRAVVLDELGPGWARTSTVQLIGLAELAGRRGPDPGDERRAELAGLLRGAGVDPGDDPLAAAGEILAAGVGADPGGEADERAGRVRPVVVAHLDADLASTAPLLDHFRGRLPDA